MRLSADELTPQQQDNALFYFIEAVFLTASPPKHVGIAVSGGGDSMAVLHATWQYCYKLKIPIDVVTVNHGLRAEAAAEAAMVAAYCAKLGVRHTTLQWDSATATGNIAAAGRDARYRLIGGWAQEREVDCVFLGHTRNDVAETFLMRLARTSGVDGLAAMQSDFQRDGVAWARPFLRLDRDMLRRYLKRHDVSWVDDPSNDDDTYDRPKARKALAALEPLGITVETLSRTAFLQAGARDTLEFYTRQEAERVVTQEAGDVLIARGAQPALDRGIEQRLLVAAIKYVGGSHYPPRAMAMIDLHIGLENNAKHTLAGCIITQTKYHTRIARELNAVEAARVWADPSMDQIWDRHWRVCETDHQMNRGRLEIRALGDHIKEFPHWRETGLPRASLMASPAVFDGETLISAPVAGYNNGYDARIVADFASFLVSR